MKVGSYEILSALGAGGMGEVYRAHDARLQRDVAIKVLRGDAAGSDALERFRREARAAGGLNHPHICTIHDIGEHDGRPFLVMELLEGQPLGTGAARVPVRSVIQFGMQLADALGAAHARGIVHRDIKPANIFVTARGDAKVLDFGVATLAKEPNDHDTASGANPLTLPGTAIGTVAYMAPEQLLGETVDARADLFALGLVLYEQATGQRAFTGTTSAALTDAVLHRQPAAPRAIDEEIPPRLEEILLKLLEKSRDLRYQHAADLVADLRRLQRDLDSGARAAAAYTEAGRDISSVAVLPFHNMSADPENSFFCDGLAEDLISALTRISGLRVAGRTSAFRFRGGDLDIRAIGEALKVGALVEGSVRRSGNRLRVTAQLVKVADGYQLWSERYDREMVDVFDIQDDIVSAIVTALAPALLAQTKGAVLRPTGNLDAYELCLKGRHYWHLRSPGTLRVAIQLFEQAIALDPDYALAHAGLADCHGLLRVYGWVRNADSQPQAVAAVTRALALDPERAEVQFSKALYLFYFDPDWRTAEPHFQQAIAASPRWSLAHLYYGFFLLSSYRFDEAALRIRHALELDPLSPFNHTLGGWSLTRCGQIEEGRRLVLRSIELQPDSIFAMWVCGVMLLKEKRPADAIEILERVVKVSRSPIFLGILGEAYGRAGRSADAEALLAELAEREARGEYVAPFARIMLYAGRGDRAGVRDCLQACVAEGASWFALNVAVYGTLTEMIRGDAELEGLLDRIYGGTRPAPGPSASAMDLNPH